MNFLLSMQPFSPGDKVSFKNEPYTGIVKRIGKGERVCVEVDGQEIMVHPSELILSERKPGGMTSQPGSLMVEKAREGMFHWLKDGDIHLVAAPASRQQVLSGQVDYWLVNRSPLNILFSLSCQTTDRFITLAQGILNSQSSCRLFSRSREEFSQWKKLHMQIIFFSHEEFHLRQPLAQDIRILVPDLKDEIKEAPEPFNFSKSLVLCHFSEEKIEKIAIEQLQKHFQEGKAQRQSDGSSSLPGDEKVVDLHIEKIDPGMKTADADMILRRQLEEFRKWLNHAIQNHYHRITFIHGVGEGVLKRALMEELKHYDGLECRQASPLKYGNGAIEILLR